jgi:DNA-binding winged helix-turn-helix (wHTH) protein/tetratricopeptide (TPR) repeat protein
MPDPSRAVGVVRFGPYEADFAGAELRKNGMRIKLQDRPFDILQILLERPGEVITRDEFRNRLWSADTFVDFDHSLNVSINKLRQALNDDAESPRFVATVGRRGYKFIALVDGTDGASPSELIATPPLLLPVPSPWAEPAVAPRQAARRTKWIVVAAVFLACGVATGWFLLSRRVHPTHALTSKDSILLADFENSTGDPVFDGALKEALAVQLEQSPFLNLVSRERVREILQYMQRAPDEKVIGALALEMCQRGGITAMLAGSIVPLGSHYVISLNAVSCRNGASLAREQVEAATREQVLHMLGTAAPELRRKLGETMASVEKFNAPLEEASTPSLEAIKAYGLAAEQRSRGQEAESIPLYKRAIALDPNFAMAYARLGTVYANRDEAVLAGEYLRKAYSLRARISEPERFNITAKYFDVVTGDVPKAIETYDLWGQTYPQNWTPFNNLAAECIEVGCWSKAEESARQALKLNPNHVFPYGLLAGALRGLGRFDEAKIVCQRAIAAHRETLGNHRLLYEIAFAQNDLVSMQEQAQWAGGKPLEEDMTYVEALAAGASGKLNEARRLFADSITSARRHGFPENGANAAAMQALVEAEFGNAVQARRQARVALDLGHGESEQGVAALALARAGDSAAAQRIAGSLEKKFPESTRTVAIRVPFILAALRIQAKEPSDAVHILEAAAPYEFGQNADFIPIYLRGQAYLLARSGTEAAHEFQKIIDHRGVDPESPLLALAHLGEARSYALTGDVPQSRRSYEEFFTLWKDADPELPVLKKARDEYAKLVH